MDTVIDNLARAIRKLATAGIEHAVVSADHGHLFFAEGRDESMRTDAPGGDTVELHRRCWIGRGGATSPGCVRVAASALGYASDLEFVFPSGAGVFRAGGGLAFHHGGPSLQEMVIPVVVCRTTGVSSKVTSGPMVVVTGAPEAVTNGIFTAVIQLGGSAPSMFAAPLAVRPLLMHAGRQVGGAGMVIGADLESESGTVTLRPGAPVTIAFVLRERDVESLRVVIQDPSTDAELYRSPSEIPCDLEF